MNTVEGTMWGDFFESTRAEIPRETGEKFSETEQGWMLEHSRGDKAERLSRGGCLNKLKGTKWGDFFQSARAQISRETEEKF